MELPANIGSYELTEFVKGKMMEMYRARDTSTGAEVRVIVLNAEASADTDVRARFLRDAREEGILDSGRFDGRYFAVMERKKAEKFMDPDAFLSTGKRIFRLSLIVYAIVIFVAIVAVATWFWYSRYVPKQNPEENIQTSSTDAPDTVRGMTYIEGGAFLAGPDNHMATVGSFYIDETEVTVGQYCGVMQCAQTPGRIDMPMVNVTLEQAREYAERVGKRLPTALEWERVTRGTKGNLFPWGNAVDPNLANVANNTALGGHGLVPAKAFRPYPEYQMIGNVWEMVDGAVKPDAATIAKFAKLVKPAPTANDQWIAVRGGSYMTTLTGTTPFDQLMIPDRYGASDVGFRCARNP